MLACKSDKRILLRVVAALAGALLLFSPYIVATSTSEPGSISAFVLGFLIFTSNMSMAVDERRRPDIANLLYGAACLAAPALVGFSETVSALWLHGAVGTIAALCGSYALYALTDARPGSAAEPA